MVSIFLFCFISVVEIKIVKRNMPQNHHKLEKVGLLVLEVRLLQEFIFFLRHAKLPSIHTTLMHSQLCWPGHVVCMPEHWLPKRLFYGEL